MKYEISYRELEGDAKVDRAVEDARRWLDTDERWDRVLCVVTNMVTQRASINQVGFVVSFAGIQGYPVEALCRYVCRLTGLKMIEYDDDHSDKIGFGSQVNSRSNDDHQSDVNQ